MKAEIEDMPFLNRGIDVTSETEKERKHLEKLWNKNAAAGMLKRNQDGSVTLTIVPTTDRYR